MSISSEDLEQSSCDDLPHAIIVDEILIRLPVKSLSRFKAVSKLWNTAISSPRFAKAHFDYSKKLDLNAKWVFVHKDGNSWLLDYDFYDDDDSDPLTKPFDSRGRYNIGRRGLVSLENSNKLSAHFNGKQGRPFGSSCGLVCFQVDHDDSIFVCNPILGLCKKISSPRLMGKPGNIAVCGFGYVSSVDDFKLMLGLRGRSEREKPAIHVFSLRKNAWKMIDTDHQYFHFMALTEIDQKGILVNKRLHWWTYDGHIIAFDLLNEVFEEVEIPNELVSKVCSLDLICKFSVISTMGGCLCLLFCQRNSVEFWLLREYVDTKSWVRLYNLDIMPSLRFCFSEFFGFTNDGKFLMYSWDNFHNCYMFLVDPNPSYPKRIVIRNFGYEPVIGVQNYAPSLFSPFGLEESMS